MCTYGEYGSDSVLITQDERTAIPEGQSVGKVDHQEHEAHGDVSRHCLLYSHFLCVLQVPVISFVQYNQIHKVTNMLY